MTSARAGNTAVHDAHQMLHNLPPERLDELHRAFAMFDKDGSGTIDKGELRQLLHSLGTYPTPLELVELMARMDVNGSGDIDFVEFATCMAEDEHECALEEEVDDLRRAFTLFDKDGSGLLSAEELRKAMKMLGVDLNEVETACLVDDIDENGDGEISFQEFLDYIMNYPLEEE